MGNTVLTEAQMGSESGHVTRNYGGDTNIYSVDGGLVQAAHQISADAIDANTRVFSENVAFAGDTLGKALATTADLAEFAYDFLGESGDRQERMFTNTLAAISGQAQRTVSDVSTAYQTARTSETSDLMKTAMYGALGLGGLVLLFVILKR